MSQEVVKSACQLCHLGCGVDVYLENGEIVDVKGSKENPLNNGNLCPKGRAMIEFEYSPDRIIHPMKKVNGQWEQISWDEAFALLVGKMQEIKGRYGAQAVAVSIGMSVLLSGTSSVSMIRKFAHAFGSSSCFSVESICFRCRIISYILTLGRFYVADPLQAKLIVIWGHNPENSAPPLATWVSKARKNGARVVTIDPRVTRSARIADLHIQPRPGTDCALLLGMMNIIINEKLYDADFVSKWTVGFEELVEHVQSYPPDKVAQITWVPEEQIKELARMYATVKPASILQGTNTLDQTSTGLNSSRAVAILQAITGNVDVPGGFIVAPKMHTSPITVEELEQKPLGIDKYSIFYSVFGREFGEGQTMVLPDAILTGDPYPIKAMIVAGSNPVLTWPNSSKVTEAFKNLDFLVFLGQFMSETAELADLFLPAATFLEREEICDYYSTLWALPFVTMRKKVLERGEAISDLNFWLKLAHKLGLEEELPWKDETEVNEFLLAPSGYTRKTFLEEHPEGFYIGERTYRTYQQKGFKTPSGKIELYSHFLEELGHDPLPEYREPPESPVNSPQLKEEYPLILTTGAREKYFTHSQHRNLPQLLKQKPEPLAEIHRETAAQHGLNDGDWAMVETKRGSIKLRIKATDTLLRGVVSIPHGWGEANVNLLTTEEAADPVLGYPALKALLCRIRPA